jgi:opacity protein-like surface antigen
MKRLLLATTAFLALASAPARAEIVLDTTGQGGTGNNVIFSQNLGGGLILGRLNGQNDEVVRFRDLSGNGNFTGAANGNDIKINNTSDLDITVFDRNNATQLGVTRDIFSIKGDGTLLIRATALETDGTLKDFNYSFVLGNGQNGFDFKAINGEFIWDVDLKVVGGSIQDFEHFRIDVAPNVGAVPEPATWAMMILGFLGIGGLGMRKKLGGIRLA